MSAWTSVTSKKKPPPEEVGTLPAESDIAVDSSELDQTNSFCTEFIIQAGQKKFNPVLSLRGLLLELHQVNPSIHIYNVEGNQKFTKDTEIPENITQFNKNFLVSPHLGRTGVGRIHLHFRLSHTYDIETLKENRSFLHYLQTQRIWLTPHYFRDTNIATAGFIFMKSPGMTHLVDYLKSLKLYLLRQESLKRPAPATPDSSDDEATEPINNQEQSLPRWTSIDNLPHLELMRRSLTIRPPSSDQDAKTLQVPVLELKCDQEHLATVREALLKSKLPVRQYGVFVPPSFFNEERAAVYKTAQRHIQFVTRLKVIPVSGIHPSLLDMKTTTPEGNSQSFLTQVLNEKFTPENNTKPPTYLFASIEASNLKTKTGKWYFLTTDEQYKSAVSFIDHQLIDIYTQAGFQRLSQTQKMPFKRGPHRLTKLSEAAASHAQHLTAQVVTGQTPSRAQVPAPRKLLPIIYDTTQFPPLSSRAGNAHTSRTKVSESTTSGDKTNLPKTPIDAAVSSKFHEMEAKMKEQSDKIEQLHQKITEQSASLTTLYQLIETQESNTSQIKEALSTMAMSISKLEQITTKIHQHQQDNLSPAQTNTIKRSKVQTEDSSPSHQYRTIHDDPMDASEQWHQQDPNMSPPHSRSSSPSL